MNFSISTNSLSNRFIGPGPTRNPNPLNPNLSSKLHFPNPSFHHSLHSHSSMALRLGKPKHRSLSNPSLIHLFSTSQNGNNDNDGNNTSQSSLDSYFSDVKDSLKNRPQSSQQSPTFTGFSRAAPSKAVSLEGIRKNLAEFRRRSPHPTEPTPSASQSQQTSFSGFYDNNNEAKRGGNFSFEALRESLRQLRPNSSNNNVGGSADSLSLKTFKDSFRLKPQEGSMVIGGTRELPVSVFGKEMREERSSRESEEMKTDFVKIYSYKELGEKLSKLRGEGWEGSFSLGQLNERLMRLREMEEKEGESRIGGVAFKDLRESLVKLKISRDEKTKKSSTQRLDILSHLGGTPSFMQHPPKEHLVEKYFHPDNMSSAEKLKINLAKVREEFKMSESDCGSARVQVAQLTTKIKHLSSILHKKDKHSLKGLLAMVQRRKRLLKYLRRTDWDSYCLVLSKLGLRDNPDFKA